MKTAELKLCNPTKTPIPLSNTTFKRQLLHKVLDILLLAASGMGIAAMLMLIAVL